MVSIERSSSTSSTPRRMRCRRSSIAALRSYGGATRSSGRGGTHGTRVPGQGLRRRGR